MRIETKFNKNTVYECFIKFKNKGLYYTLNYYIHELKKVPDTGIYMHIKPGYQNLVKFLYTIEDECNENNKHLEKRKVGEGPVDAGEYWGTFVDYFMIDNYYADKFNKIVDQTAFSSVPILKI